MHCLVLRISDHVTPPPDEGFIELPLHNWPIFNDQFVRTTDLVPVWGVLQLEVVGLTPGETSCLIQTVLIHKSECSVHKSALKGSSIFTPDGSFFVPTDETSRNCVCEVIPAGPKATSAQGDVEQLLTWTVPSVFMGSIWEATSTVHAVFGECFLGRASQLWQTWNGLW